MSRYGHASTDESEDLELALGEGDDARLIGRHARRQRRGDAAQGTRSTLARIVEADASNLRRHGHLCQLIYQ
jgi:hypothetical protein